MRSALVKIRKWLSAAAAALPCFYISWVLLNVWWDPMAWDDGVWIRFGVGLLLLEFVLIHSGAFMGALFMSSKSLKLRTSLLFALITFYGVMVVGFSFSLQLMDLLWMYGFIVAGRVASFATNAELGAQSLLARSAVGIVLYIFIVMGTVFIPVPELGISIEVLDQVYPERGDGAWEEEPQRAIVGAALYFVLMGLCELFLLHPAEEQAAEQAS